MTKKKSIHLLAHAYATRRFQKKSPTEWNEGEKGTYWHGLYEGYLAGVKYARRVK